LNMPISTTGILNLGLYTTSTGTNGQRPGTPSTHRDVPRPLRYHISTWVEFRQVVVHHDH
jgi:hypothetical protein